eukprot:scaffold9859_cov122-Isochrysis_galbana.AAC.5
MGRNRRPRVRPPPLPPALRTTRLRRRTTLYTSGKVPLELPLRVACGLVWARDAAVSECSRSVRFHHPWRAARPGA